MNAEPSRPRPLRQLVVGLACCGATLLAAGCGPPTLGPQAYERAKLIENLTEYRRPEQAATARGLIEADLAAGALTAEERDALLGPLDLAEDGQWEAAAAAARELLVAQQRW
ncbi:hypothetical protein [Alienimonas californiensis]|uniref:Uncharacterized protein n=1 Tax=Alienimonas californiensis TaxID=2527989 RepID=A0A517PEV4_9PLAN|nr:hypothetical protein [Alienimonas californiensis]QDT17893.1 hypothetical protein CA12_40290 [Alienimonas californiensis]